MEGKIRSMKAEYYLEALSTWFTACSRIRIPGVGKAGKIGSANGSRRDFTWIAQIIYILAVL